MSEEETLEQLARDSAKYHYMQQKVASNEALLKLLNTVATREQFVDALIELVKEEGLTFYQRDFINLVTMRVTKALTR